MSGRMWQLSDFRFDDGIVADEVDVYVDGELEPMRRDDAIEFAHSQGLHLIAEWPTAPGDTPTCKVAKLALPLRWETVPDEEPEIDERLWFDARCGGRDFLMAGHGHTFRGQMTAWCPTKERSYNVSLGEMGDMADETRYFVLGFLSGNEPAPPEDEDGHTEDRDLAAWFSATTRFRRTGYWYGRWSTCEECGCVLLPDSASSRCGSHE